MTVELAVLGELRMWVRGIEVSPSAPKEKAVLALLVASPGQVVATDRLIEELWPELPADRARRVLQVRVSAVRKVLRDAGAPTLLQPVPPGYRLDLAAATVDAHRFEDLLDQGRRLASEGDPVAAAAVLGDALGLWRGEAFADVRGSPAVEVEAARLTELRLVAVEERIAAELDAGRHGRLVAELEALVAVHPLRERFWEQRILALYRCGRQADALRACSAVRQRLREELGVDPGPGLRSVEQAVLEQRAELRVVPAPDGIGAVHDEVGHDGPHAGRTRDEGAPRRSNLPVVEPLIGRAVDVERVVRLVQEHRLVTVTGPGGIGKTRLAVAVAQVIAGSSAADDGTWLVELASIRDAADVVGAIAGVVPVAAMAATTTELIDRIGVRPLLLVLDNCEHVVDEAARVVARLLAGCPAVRVLCTSQESLSVPSEHLWPLRPLDPDAAVALFHHRARAVRPEVAEDPVTAEIVERLDRLPLAIELAAGRVATLTPAEIAARLDDRFGLLSGGVRGVHPRHRALDAMVAWSHELLAPQEQVVFRRLGAFAGSFDREAVAAVARDASTSEEAVLDSLDHLVRRSLVEVQTAGDHSRYRLVETLRHYAIDRLADAGETDAVARRHAEWYAEHALTLDAIGTPGETAALTRAIADFDNYRVAVGHVLACRDPDLAVRLVSRLWRLDVLMRAEMLDWARDVLELPGASDQPDAGLVHLIVAHLALPLGLAEEAHRAAERARRLLQVEDAWVQANTLFASTLPTGELEGVRAVLEAAIPRLSQPANVLFVQAHLMATEAYGLPRTPYEPEVLVRTADSTDRPTSRALTRCMVALGLVGRGRAEEAVPLLHQALEILEPGHNRTVVGIANEILALATGRGGSEPDDDLAVRAAGALELIREYPMGLGFALIGMLTSGHRHGRGEVTALLAGYLAANQERLDLPVRSAELMAGRPLDDFVSDETRPLQERGRTMSAADLEAELARLASDPLPG